MVCLDRTKGVFLAHTEPDAHPPWLDYGLTISKAALVHGVILFQDVELSPSLSGLLWGLLAQSLIFWRFLSVKTLWFLVIQSPSSALSSDPMRGLPCVSIWVTDDIEQDGASWYLWPLPLRHWMFVLIPVNFILYKVWCISYVSNMLKLLGPQANCSALQQPVVLYLGCYFYWTRYSE